MNAPTLYFLTVNERHSPCGEGKINYEVWEQHKCQEKGCFKTQPEFVKLCFTKNEVESLIKDWKCNPPLNGELADVEWIHAPMIPELEDLASIKAHGVYHNLTELALTMAELGGLKPYKLVNEFGDFAGYTFEVVE